MKDAIYANGFHDLRRNEYGGAEPGYAFLASLVAIAAIGFSQAFGETASGMLTDIATILTAINGLMTQGLAFAS